MFCEYIGTERSKGEVPGKRLMNGLRQLYELLYRWKDIDRTQFWREKKIWTQT